MLLRLAPGLRLVRRGTDHVQVGLLPSRRTVLARTATTARVLDHVIARQPVPVDEPGVADVVRRLVGSGCAVPVEAPMDAPADSTPVLRVSVVPTGGAVGFDVRDRLRGAGLVPVTAGEVDVVLLISTGEPSREVLDPLVRRGRPHLVVRLVDAAVQVGPFVVPGRTACLRCLDAHAVDTDPDHLPVLSRYIAASQAPRGDGAADLPDPVLVDLGLAMAVRDLAARATGGRPTTWSATVQLGPEPGREERRTWTRHPECGCSWPASLPVSGRMEG